MFTSTQIAQFRAALQGKRTQILRAREERDSQAAMADAGPGDAVDVAEGVIEDRDRAALAEHDLALLNEIEHALAKLDAGTYGLSEVSGRPIAIERLKAVPWARQEAEEAERMERAMRR